MDRNKSLLEISDRKAEVLIVRNDLATEASAARAAELVIRNNLATEIVDARAAELVIRNNLATEIVNARAAELVLRTDLAAEVFRSTGTDVANFQTLDGYITAEQTARAARDVLLTNKVNTEFADLYNRMLYLESVVASLRNEAIYVAVQAVHSNV